NRWTRSRTGLSGTDQCGNTGWMRSTQRSPAGRDNGGATNDNRPHEVQPTHPWIGAGGERAATVHVEDRYDTGIADVWSAIAEPERLARWIAEVDGDLRPGGLFQVRFTTGWEGPGRVDVCDPPRRLLLTLSPEQPDQTEVEAVLA